MTVFEAALIAEGVTPATEEETTRAWQHLHDTGVAYQLQGWFGRTARDLLNQGVITP